MTPATELGDLERAHVERMRERIAAEIDAAGGWIGFDRYMELALYAPGLGYYSAGAHKLGPGGDFTTAPEVSRLFGGCVARQCAEILGALGGGSILEIGAGSGRLAADVLSRLDALGCVPERYLVLEISADLRERQRRSIADAVPHLARRVEWLDAPPDVAFDGVVLANEVLDALPVTRFRWHPQAGECEEMGVTREGYAASSGRRGPGAMPSLRNALSWRKRAAVGRRAIPRSIANDSARGPQRSRSRIARASRSGSITACRGATTIFPSGATAR